MSSKQEWRDQYIAECVKGGLSLMVARQVLSLAKTLHRLAEAQCNGDWPYANGGGGNQYNGWKGREGKDCPICGDNWAVGTVKVKGGCPDCRAQARVRLTLKGTGFYPVFQGDPRGCVVRIFAEGTPEDQIADGRVRGIGA